MSRTTKSAEYEPRRWGGKLGLAALVVCALALILWFWHGSALISASLSSEIPSEWAMQSMHDGSSDFGSRPAAHRRASVSLEEVSIDLQTAVLVAEDAGFFGHGAIDLDETWAAVKEWYHGRRLRGASTISQQLAKNLFLSETRSYWRKANELRLAWWLERKLNKRRIFELYLNVIELGEGIYGVEDGAQAYFGVRASQVTLDQALDLAAAIPSPRHDNPATCTRIFSMRRSWIAQRLSAADALRKWLTRGRTQKPPPTDEPAAGPNDENAADGPITHH
jgi:monofunctional biosynthetic peptidoglycan transglycosylase